MLTFSQVFLSMGLVLNMNRGLFGFSHGGQLEKPVVVRPKLQPDKLFKRTLNQVQRMLVCSF